MFGVLAMMSFCIVFERVSEYLRFWAGESQAAEWDQFYVWASQIHAHVVFGALLIVNVLKVFLARQEFQKRCLVSVCDRLCSWSPEGREAEAQGWDIRRVSVMRIPVDRWVDLGAA